MLVVVMDGWMKLGRTAATAAISACQEITILTNTHFFTRFSLLAFDNHLVLCIFLLLLICNPSRDKDFFSMAAVSQGNAGNNAFKVRLSVSLGRGCFF